MRVVILSGVEGLSAGTPAQFDSAHCDPPF